MPVMYSKYLPSMAGLLVYGLPAGYEGNVHCRSWWECVVKLEIPTIVFYTLSLAVVNSKLLLIVQQPELVISIINIINIEAFQY
jgi:hypothetical protein